MLALLGDIEFHMTKKQIESISEEIDFGITSTSRIGNYPKHQAASKGSEVFTLVGKVLMQKIDELEDLKDEGRKQEPKTLSIESLPTIEVMILKLSTSKKNFLDTGEHLEQSFTLKLERYFR